MFNFRSVNTAEVNASSQLPAAPELSILATEDINVLSWNSPTFTDFFKLYWSENSFDSIDEPGVHLITEDIPTPAADVATEVSYTHDIPAVFSLRVLYYRVAAFNENGQTLSNIVNNYNFKIAIYEDLYDATLEELLLRFTPELRTQYQDSILWQSFVQSICSELAQGRFEIKEALKQLNLQKAIGVFLNLWNNVSGISRINLIDEDTGLPVPESDGEYRQRLVDNIFWDKISNSALKKTLLLKLGYNADVKDVGVDVEIFRNVPLASTPKYDANYGSTFRPGELIWFLNYGPNASATCVSDDGTTLVFTDYHAPPGYPTGAPGTGNGAYPYNLFSSEGLAFATPTAPAIGGTITHGTVTCAFASYIPTIPVGSPLVFTPSGAQGKVVSFISGVLTFEKSGTTLPNQYDIIKAKIPAFGGTSDPVALLTSTPTKLTSESSVINSKILSNVYSVNLGELSLGDEALNTIYDEISPLAALGNVLTKILQNVSASFDDWESSFGNIPYGPIFMQGPTYTGDISTEGAPLWSAGAEIYMDNQWDMSSTSPTYTVDWIADPTPNGNRLFYGNDGPDDIIILTRTT